MILRKLPAFFGFVGVFLSAQETLIDTVYIYDRQLQTASETQWVQKISSSDIEKNSTNFSETLRFQTPVYIKENGRGMVSSPSFRGTTAQQTAFIWNGININSVFLGQGDINNLGLLSYNEIAVKSGGGSLRYGSGAVGGSIHLNDRIGFNEGLKVHFFGEVASFGTVNTALKSSYSNKNISINVGAAHVESDNDYEVLEKSYLNKNGRYSNTTVHFGYGYGISPKHKIYWQSMFYTGLQHFPVFSDSQIYTKYTTENQRNLLTWNYSSLKTESDLKLAFLEENFEYYEDIAFAKSSGGTARTFLAKEDFKFKINRNVALNVLAEVQHIKGIGYQSGINHADRNVFSSATILKYDIPKRIYLELGVKKEFIQNYETPLLFSFGSHIHPLHFYAVKLNVSKNFRAPSFNDLYWQPGGDPLLKPETAWQAELVNQIKFRGFDFAITPYFMDIKNMIRWLPTNGSFWAPVNTDQVRSYGLESSLKLKKTFGNHSVNLNLGYAYTHSQNSKTGKQLMYVPYHKAFGTSEYSYRNFSVYMQGMFNGITYTTSDMSDEFALKPYLILNSGFSATFWTRYRLGIKINNLTNKVYETTAYYPLPKRNFAMNFNYNF